MKWSKSPDALVQAFDHCLPIVPGVERKAMYGYPCAFVNGHLFCGLHQDSIIVHLPEARRHALMAEGANVFDPMPGHSMKEYVVVPPEIVQDRQRLRALLGEALANASSLAPSASSASAAKTAKGATAPAAPKKTVPASKAPAKKKATAKKTAPAKKKAAAKKTAPTKKKAPAKRKAAPTKKGVAKKTAARKASPKKKRSR